MPTRYPSTSRNNSSTSRECAAPPPLLEMESRPPHRAAPRDPRPARGPGRDAPLDPRPAEVRAASGRRCGFFAPARPPRSTPRAARPEAPPNACRDSPARTGGRGAVSVAHRTRPAPSSCPLRQTAIDLLGRPLLVVPRLPESEHVGAGVLHLLRPRGPFVRDVLVPRQKVVFSVGLVLERDEVCVAPLRDVDPWPFPGRVLAAPALNRLWTCNGGGGGRGGGRRGLQIPYSRIKNQDSRLRRASNCLIRASTYPFRAHTFPVWARGDK